MCRSLGWLNTEKSELDPKQTFNFVGYQFDLQSGRVRPTPDRWQNLQTKIQELLAIPVCSVREFVSDRTTDGHRKTSPFGQVTHEAHSMASQKPLENSGIIRREDSSTQMFAPSSTMVAKGKQCPYWPTITPNTTRATSLYRRVKRRLGRSLKRLHRQGHLVPTGKQVTHKLSGAQGSSTSLKGVSGFVRRKNGSDSNRQYHSSSLHKQRGRYEVRPTLCPPMEDINLVYQQAGHTPGTTHSRQTECGGRQTIQTGPNHSNGVFPVSTSFSKDMPQVAPTDPPLPDQAKIVKSSHSCKLLWQSSQEPQTVRGITSAYNKKCYRTGKQTDLTRVLQLTILGAQTQQQMEANPRFEQSEFFPKNRKIQNGNPGNHQDLPPTGRMGNLHRLQGRLFPHSNTGTVQEIPKISRPGADLSIQSSPFRLIHSSDGIHRHSQGGEIDGHSKGYKDPPVPRRLVGESHIPPGMSLTYPTLTGDVPEPRLVGEHRKVGARPKANLQFRRLPVRPPVRSGQTDTGQMAKFTNQDTGTSCHPSLFGERVCL